MGVFIPDGSLKPSLGSVALDTTDVLAQGLVGCWLFNTGTGRALDSSLRANHGTISGAAQGRGRFGPALSFDGINDVVTIPYSASLMTAVSGYTITAWVNPTNRATYYFVASRLISNGASSNNFELRLESGTGKVELLGLGGGAKSAAAIPTGAWTFVVGTYSVVAPFVGQQIYINGTLDGTANQAVNDATGRGILIGTREDNFSFFLGGLDNLRYYNRALNITEIRRLYYEPFAALRSVRRKWVVPAPAGGTVYNVDVAEGSASAADTTDAARVAFTFPIADIASGGWLPSTGVALYPMLDEPAVDYADYIFSPNNPTTEQFEVLLAPSGDPGVTSGHGVDIGVRAMNLDTHFDFNLVQGSTILDSWTEAVTVAEGDVVRTHNFSGAVIAAITNRSDLRIRGVARA